MPNWMIALLVGGVVGLILGVFIARKSATEKPIKGGTLAQVFHYLGASAFVAVAPTVLVSSYLYKLHFFPRLIRGVGLGVSLLAVAAIFLILYAVFETQAAQSKSS